MNRILQSVIAAIGGVVGVVVLGPHMLNWLVFGMPSGMAMALTFGGTAMGIAVFCAGIPAAVGGAATAVVVAGIESAFGRRKG